MGMEHLVSSYRLQVDKEDQKRAEGLLASDTVEENFYIILLDREHNIVRSHDGFPEDAVDAVVVPKYFTFIGEYSSEEGVFQFFLSKRYKTKIPLLQDIFYWDTLRNVLSENEHHETFRKSYSETVLGGYVPPTDVFGAWGFGASPGQADSLGKLVTRGKKRATAGLVASYEYDKDPLPKEGDVSIILDGDGMPMAVIRTTEALVLPYRDVSPEMAAEEGEGDGSLRYWRKEHEKYFRKECKSMDMQFSEEIPIVFERFEVLKVF